MSIARARACVYADARSDTSPPAAADYRCVTGSRDRRHVTPNGGVRYHRAAFVAEWAKVRTELTRAAMTQAQQIVISAVASKTRRDIAPTFYGLLAA